jgi:hypothetical protein
MLRGMGSVEIPKLGFVLAGNLQHVSGKPWAASAQVRLDQNARQRILIEPRGTRRIEAQTLLDLRVSRAIRIGDALRVELLCDVLNALNDASAEGIVSDTLMNEKVFTTTFNQPNVWLDPRRVMFGIRMNLGKP